MLVHDVPWPSRCCSASPSVARVGCDQPPHHHLPARPADHRDPRHVLHLAGVNDLSPRHGRAAAAGVVQRARARRASSASPASSCTPSSSVWRSGSCWSARGSGSTCARSAATAKRRSATGCASCASTWRSTRSPDGTAALAGIIYTARVGAGQVAGRWRDRRPCIVVTAVLIGGVSLLRRPRHHQRCRDRRAAPLRDRQRARRRSGRRRSTTPSSSGRS